MTAGLPRCSVIVVTHHSEATLAQCARCVLQQSEVDWQLIVVDNASQVDPSTLLPDDARIQLLRNDANLGFSRACNQGAALAEAEWLLFLNPDCFLPEGGLRRLIDLFSAAPAMGLLGAQLVNPDGSEQAASRRPTPTPQRLLFGADDSETQPSVVHLADGVEAVQAISGALMLLPRDLWRQLGGLDEAYRLHCEDLDLCRRVLQAGRAVGIASDLRVTHVKGTSSTRRPLWVEWQKHRGMWRYFNKFDRATTPFWLTALVVIGISLRLPVAALRAWWRARSSLSPFPGQP